MVPRPKAYVDERSSKELENFLWDMKQYFKAAKIPDAEEGSSLQVSPMVLLNSLPVISPEDPKGEDAIMQPVLEVIKV
ncbi:unnamed protein product, partial [Prunus brigantina]